MKSNRILNSLTIDAERPAETALSLQQKWQGCAVTFQRQLPYEVNNTCLALHNVVLTLEGQCDFTHQSEKDIHAALHVCGDATILPAGNPNALRWEGDAFLLHICLEPQFLQKIADNLPVPLRQAVQLLPVLQTQDPHIQCIGHAFKAELETDADDALFGELLASALAVHLLRKYSTTQTVIPRSPGGLPKHKLKAAFDYIDAHLDQPISLETLAAKMNLSKYHFCRVFKQSTGMTLREYVLQQRIDRAKQLLQRRDLSLSDIALNCGFYNHTHFSKQFRQHVGVTPTNYRNCFEKLE